MIFDLLAILLVLAGCSSEPVLEPAGRGSGTVLASASADRSDAFALDGATVAGDLHVFVDAPAARVARVAWYLDDAWPDGEPLRVAEAAPFDLLAAEDGRALAWDTDALASGVHRLVAELEPAKGPARVAIARFTVAVADDAPAPGDPTPTDPTEPAPTDPVEPEPSEPDPADPEPADPDPSDPDGPEPTDPAAEIWRPAPGTSWQWQLTGTIDLSVDAEVFDVDLFDVPESTIDELHARGRRVICYFSAGSYEDWRRDAHLFPDSVRGKSMSGWDEDWLDVRRIDLLAPVMTGRLDLAAAKGCDAVEPDNVDGYANDTGFPLSYADQLAYNRFLAEEAHARGLAIGLKNDVEQIPDLVDDFDFAVNEECYRWNECHRLVPFVEAGKAVFGAEYGLDTNEFCPTTNALDLDFILKEMELGAWRESCR